MTNQIPLHTTKMVTVSASVPETVASKLNDLASERMKDTGKYWSNASLIREILAEYFGMVAPDDGRCRPR